MINIEAATLTDPGLERDSNEDSTWSQICTTSEGKLNGLFIVCDGMGGHLAGEYASHWAIEAVKREMADFIAPKDPRATIRLQSIEDEVISSPDSAPTRQQLPIRSELSVRAAIQKANEVVYGYAAHKPEEAHDAGTTITMALIIGQLATIANVGDSRTYLIRENQLRQITDDHSLVANMVSTGQIKPEEAYAHPQRNIIFRSLGQKRDVKIDIFQESLKPGDFLLLCSDGLWEMVQESKTITAIIEGAQNPKEACKELVDAANHAGGIDNIGVVVIKVT